jgi:ribosomal protein L37AE/L43A
MLTPTFGYGSVARTRVAALISRQISVVSHLTATPRPSHRSNNGNDAALPLSTRSRTRSARRLLRRHPRRPQTGVRDRVGCERVFQPGCRPVTPGAVGKAPPSSLACWCDSRQPATRILSREKNTLYPRGMAIIVCPSCGARNRVGPIASGFPRCPRCKSSLAWLVDADAQTFEAETSASVPVVAARQASGTRAGAYARSAARRWPSSGASKLARGDTVHRVRLRSIRRRVESGADGAECTSR